MMIIRKPIKSLSTSGGELGGIVEAVAVGFDTGVFLLSSKSSISLALSSISILAWSS